MTLEEAIRTDTPLMVEYQDMSLPVGDLFLGTFNGKPGFAWTVPGWGRDPGGPCHALVADLRQTMPGGWSDDERDIGLHTPWDSGINQQAEAAAIRQWYKIGGRGDRATRRREALEVILDYNPTFQPDPEH
jgi:hypothetical protein